MKQTLYLLIFTIIVIVAYFVFSKPYIVEEKPTFVEEEIKLIPCVNESNCKG